MSTPEPILERWVWLIASLGIAILAAAIQWLLSERIREGRMKPPSALAIWLLHALRLLYAVGIPAAALLWRGVLTPTGLGLKPFAGNWSEWASGIGWTFAVVCTAWAIIKLGLWNSHRLSPHQRHAATRHSSGVALREAVYHQTHWAFYREPFVLLWGVELGTWLGLLLVAFEAALNPNRWLDLQEASQGRDLLVRIGLAIASAILFIATQNLWLMILGDAALGWMLGQTRHPHPPAA